MSDPTRVIVVDDHKMFLDALEMVLEGEPDIAMLGAFRNAEDALHACSLSCPDVVLMDVDLPGMGGIEATTRIKESCPDAQIIVITAFQQRSVLTEAIEAGAAGFVPKAHAADELIAVIRKVAAGDVVVPGDLPRTLAELDEARGERQDERARLSQLTSREFEILGALTEGKSTAAMAKDLYISPQTVQSHMKSILWKLAVHSKLEAALLAVRHNLSRVPRRSGERW
jgi:DNA-binding NarL/FixJ family response regulator